MQRQLVLISNPGNPNESNYRQTTEQAIDRWEQFFRSPIGGYWQDGEIIRFGEKRIITQEEFCRLMIPLNTVQCDYSVIVFCGHGCCTSDNKDAIQLPIPTAENPNLFPVDELLGGGTTDVRRTVILDTCRSVISFTFAQLFEQREFSEIYKIDGYTCQEYYNSVVMDSTPHVEILYSTSLHQKAFASLTGSEYSDAMSNLVRKKSAVWKMMALSDRYGKFDFTMCDLQKEMITELVKRNKQVPDYKILGKANRSFPFVAMRLPTDRTIYTEDAVVEVIED